MPAHDLPAPDSPAAAAPILVLVAMAEEAAPLHARLTGARDLPTPFAAAPRPVRAVAGDLAGRPVVVVTAGIGIAAASAATTWGLVTLAPAAVVVGGSAGGLGTEVEVGSVIVGESFRYSIADATAFGYAPGQVPGQPEAFAADADLVAAAERAAISVAPSVHRGLMLSGDAFVTAPLAGPMRALHPGALSADMETTGIAQVAIAAGVPCVAVRAISDLCGPAADQQFHLELDVVAETSAAVVTALVGQLGAAGR